MADQPTNIAKGRVIEFYNRVKSNDPSTSGFILVLLKTAEADATLIDYDTLDAMLTAGGGAANVQANFTNYARKTLTDADLAALPAPDDTNNRYDVDLPDQTWTSAGGATNNTLVKAILCYAPDVAGADTTLVPVAHYDFAATTDGSDLTLQWNASGFYRAA